MNVTVERKSVPIQEAVDIIQEDISGIHDELAGAGKMVGKITAWGIFGLIALGSIVAYQQYSINELKKMQLK